MLHVNQNGHPAADPGQGSAMGGPAERRSLWHRRAHPSRKKLPEAHLRSSQSEEDVAARAEQEKTQSPQVGLLNAARLCCCVTLRPSIILPTKPYKTGLSFCIVPSLQEINPDLLSLIMTNAKKSNVCGWNESKQLNSGCHLIDFKRQILFESCIIRKIVNCFAVHFCMIVAFFFCYTTQLTCNRITLEGWGCFSLDYVICMSLQ